MAKKSRLPKTISFGFDQKDFTEINKLKMTNKYKFLCYSMGTFYYTRT